MTASVTVIDYGIGNLYSVSRALEHVGGDVVLSADPHVIENSERLILPGVGAFEDGMRGLRDRGLVEPIKRYAAKGLPLLGICLGMQMLATTSAEFGEHEGLGLIAGTVVAVPSATTEGERQKIPHIAWSALSPSAGAEWRGTFLEDTPPGTSAYLVHSFHLVPDDPAHLLADCFYGNHRLTAAVRAGKVFGAQFHPEKSGAAGLQMLAAFLRQ
ncbi:imidazole glycerol phosphate synthase subunit HisH [Bradyrhizobium sediminis]|uniref:Imidazole glycerol phosphate synthase subunit HisH n=1 Tax=Bradyrhizobium sediminis TaxID=2840469 RepID=A0A975NM27_9BRAD|nr:imidazole glycerol phosphate synthase subunit HisH [Bradyrhizobium sediminis]QWG17051.1 imidazole glycerol phosphate synthase subunit HisH [Bradyrhizobium sediminis]